MKGISLNIVLQSHLSDAQMEMQFNPQLGHNRITFVKKLLSMRDENLIGDRITEDELNKIWKTI